MSGLTKPKEYDWKDSNLANFGSDDEKKVKLESAESEPAWEGAGKEVGLQIWRIEKFLVKQWPVEEYGEFFSGDSYIILHTYVNEGEDELQYDVHFWIGKYSSQDEYATAAYKTVELDTLLGDKPIQHREVMNHESPLFKDYFEKTGFTINKGGVDTGFNRVLPEHFCPKMYKVSKKGKTIEFKGVPMKKAELDSGDVFVIDAGDKIYQWNGEECQVTEKFNAAGQVDKLQAARGGKPKTLVLEERSTSGSHPAMMLLSDAAKKEKAEVPVAVRVIKRITDSDGSLDMEDVDEFSRAVLKSEDVFLVCTEDHVFCWVGKDASIDERKNALGYACNYLNKTETPWLPVTVIAEGKENDAFHACFA